MLKTGKIKMFSMALAALFAAGCTVIRELPGAEKNVEPQSEEYAKARELLEAFLRDDGGKFVSLLPEEMRKNFTVERYQLTRHSVVDSLGEPKSFTYLTKLDMPVFSPFVRKITFERTDREGNKTTGEALFRVVTGKNDEGIVICGFQFL